MKNYQDHELLEQHFSTLSEKDQEQIRNAAKELSQLHNVGKQGALLTIYQLGRFLKQWENEKTRTAHTRRAYGRNKS